MAEIIKMPRLSDTMTEGVIAEWVKQVGDKVEKGDILANIQTDKATMELESFKSGYLLHIGGDTDTAIPVDGLLAIIGEQGENIEHLIAQTTIDSVNIALEKQLSESATEETTPQQVDLPPTLPEGNDVPEEVVIMPRLSDTMENGTIIKWYKAVGDSVAKGDLLAEVETDKATMDLESFKNGYMLHIGVDEGGSVAVNSLVCIIGEKDKNVDSIIKQFDAVSKSASSTDEVESTPSQKTEVATPTTVDNSSVEVNHSNRIYASPLAKKMAEEKQISLEKIAGSGEGRRIVKKDIEAFLASGTPTVPQTQTSVSMQSNNNQTEGFIDTPASQMRTVIAKRLVESKQHVPHFYLKMELVMDEVIKQRAILNKIASVKLSFNDIIIMVVAKALRHHPEVNASWIDNVIRTYYHVHVGSAVAVPDGLVVPVVKFADTKSLTQLATETKSLYQKAKDKKLQIAEMSGATFTVSNLGMMDIDDFSAIINPPEGAILAVGKIKEVVVRKDADFTVESRMSITLSCDHRVVDGAVGAAFLQTIKRYIESPLSIML